MKIWIDKFQIKYEKFQLYAGFNIYLNPENYLDDYWEIIDLIWQWNIEGMYRIENELYYIQNGLYLIDNCLFDINQVLRCKMNVIEFEWLNVTYGERLKIENHWNNKMYRNLKSRKRVSFKRALEISKLLNKDYRSVFLNE